MVVIVVRGKELNVYGGDDGDGDDGVGGGDGGEWEGGGKEQSYVLLRPIFSFGMPVDVVE